MREKGVMGDYKVLGLSNWKDGFATYRNEGGCRAMDVGAQVVGAQTL